MDLGILCGLGNGDHLFGDRIKKGMIILMNRQNP
jgi:hypothetical protein